MDQYFHRHFQQQGQFEGTSSGSLEAAGYFVKVAEEGKKKEKWRGGGKEREGERKAFISENI